MPAPPSCCHRTCSIWSKRCALGSSSWTVEKRWRMAPLPSWHREPTWLLPGRTSSRSSSRSPVTPLTSKNLEHVAKLNRDVVQAFRPACHGGPEGPHYIQFCNPLLERRTESSLTLPMHNELRHAVSRTSSYVLRFAFCVAAGATAAAAAAPTVPLVEAVKRQDKTVTRTLLKQRADVNAADVEGMTALH